MLCPIEAPRTLGKAAMESTKLPAICCIPISESTPNEENQTDCHGHGVINHDSSMVLKLGPHRFHAVSSRDINAGTVILQCLPFAHSLLVPPGMQGEQDLSNDDACGVSMRCSRCFVAKNDKHRPSGLFGRCSKCRVVSYCSRSCQTQDWIEQHKLECLYYVKRRKLPIGHLCAEDAAIPLLLRTFTKLKFMRENYSPRNSSTGNNGVDHLIGQGASIIISCGPSHFSSMSVSQKLITSNTYLNSPLVSPALILAKDLMESFAVRGNLLNQNKTRAALDIWGYDRSNKSNTGRCSTIDQAIRWANNAFEKNNFGIVNALHSPIGEGVYPCAALLNHSCHPNCILRYKFGMPRHQRDDQYYQPILQIVAARDVRAGEELCHSYVDLTLPTEVRRSRLKETHGFVCECVRCVGCLVRLPKNRERWALWPLMHGLRVHGGFDSDEESSGLIDVGIDDATTWCQGLSQEDQSRVNHHSEVLQHKANQSMIDDDSINEVQYLKNAVAMYNDEGKTCWSPFHVKLYAVRSLYLTSLLGCGGEIKDSIEQCEHVVSFLALVTSHVENHPLLGLQLFTLGDLYVSAAESGVSTLHYKLKARAAFRWANKVMTISHGEDDALVMSLKDNIANMTENM